MAIASIDSLAIALDTKTNRQALFSTTPFLMCSQMQQTSNPFPPPPPHEEFTVFQIKPPLSLLSFSLSLFFKENPSGTTVA
jgi:hypothetical protein